MNEKYLNDNHLHLRVRNKIDKKLLHISRMHVGTDDEFVRREVLPLFEGVVDDLIERHKRYESIEEDEMFKTFQYDMFIFSKEELEMFVDQEIFTRIDQLQQQGDL